MWWLMIMWRMNRGNRSLLVFAGAAVPAPRLAGDERLTIASIDVAADRLATMVSLKALVLGEAMVPA